MLISFISHVTQSKSSTCMRECMNPYLQIPKQSQPLGCKCNTSFHTHEFLPPYICNVIMECEDTRIWIWKYDFKQVVGAVFEDKTNNHVMCTLNAAIQANFWQSFENIENRAPIEMLNQVWRLLKSVPSGHVWSQTRIKGVGSSGEKQIKIKGMWRMMFIDQMV